MAPTTDLEGFLKNDEQCLFVQLTHWLTEEAGAGATGPWVVAMSGRASGSASWKKLSIGNLTVTTPNPDQVPNLLEKIRGGVHKDYGDDPVCQLRCVAYRDGKSQDPAVDMTRSIAPPSMSDMNAAGQLKFMLDRFERQSTVLFNHNTMLVQAVAQSNAAMASSIATLATARGTASAASDVGSVGGVVGTLLLLAAWPSIRRVIGNGGDTLEGLVGSWQGRLKGLIEKPDDQPGDGSVPALSAIFGGGGAPRIEGPAPAANAEPTEPPPQLAQQRVDIDDTLRRIKLNGQTDAVIAAVLRDPELKQAAFAAAFGG